MPCSTSGLRRGCRFVKPVIDRRRAFTPSVIKAQSPVPEAAMRDALAAEGGLLFDIGLMHVAPERFSPVGAIA